MTVIMEVFSGDPPCPACKDVLALADEYAGKYSSKLKVIKLIGKQAMAKFEEYKLGCTPDIRVPRAPAACARITPFPC
jgi:hypothetical protein